MPQDVVWFSEVDKEDIKLVGGKGANLGEMVKANFPVPNGFIVTAHAYFNFLKQNNLEAKFKNLINTVNFDKHDSLSQVSDIMKKEILDGQMDPSLVVEIYSYYKKLGGRFKDPLVAVRSSATAEDLPNASFAGQQETFLNVSGESNLIHKIKECWASLFEERAIFYRHENKFNQFSVGIAVPVQKMVESDKSGVMFSIDPVTNDKGRVVIEAIYGLGELIVQGKVRPDHYEVSKTGDLIIHKEIGTQTRMLKKAGAANKETSVSPLSKSKQKISDKEIIELAKLAKKLEKHYFFPQDIEWAIEGGEIYIVQTRPITTISEKKEESKEQKITYGPLVLKGDGASPGIAVGPVKVIEKASEIDKIKEGDILVTMNTNPDFVPAMKKASAIVTDSGGRTSHAAIVSRELGIPAVVGTNTATKELKSGSIVTVNGMTGEIFKGGFPITNKKSQIVEEDEIKTATKVYMNLAEPEIAQRESQRNAQGVGLLRAEFMMAGIGVHPKKMIKDGKSKQYIEKLATDIEKFCAAFYPRPVVYRTSDFKTNEYQNLTGGKEYEPVEPNPMLGYRGSFRYIHDPDVFSLELEAIKLVRNKKGLKNLWIMLPFVRTPKELEEVKKIIAAHGLTRSQSFKLWMMVEIPSNVILIEDFISKGIDGISIGTNDLTMLVLGTDRDNNEVAREYDEGNEAVLWSIERVIKAAGKHDITSSICGEAASKPAILERAIEAGVTSVSVSPDMVSPTRREIAKLEERIFTKN